ncbi:hypothetical protein [Oceanobacillus massiliensis]|uniref:hypothetical protein n=1 Tax=Oceanobacillus massiliensis TaxID=1465765 RepID=UPI0030170CD7
MFDASKIEAAYLISTFEVPPGLKVYVNGKFICRTLGQNVALTPVHPVKAGDVIKLVKAGFFNEQTVLEKTLHKYDLNYQWLPKVNYSKIKNQLVKVSLNIDILGERFNDVDYIGDLQDGIPHGYGKAYYTDSEDIAYEGDWKEGKPHGEGIFFPQYTQNGFIRHFENGIEID